MEEQSCPYCGGRTRVPHPAPFSLEDKYLRYRLMVRKAGRKSEGDKDS